MRAVHIGLVVGGLLLASSAANAQTNQIKPRVLLMVDTSGSMNFHLNDNNTTGGDGSDAWTSGTGLLRSQATTFGFAPYEGYQIQAGAPVCPAPGTATFDGVNSRLYNAKVAVTNVIFGSGDIDWGLMRYNGTDCAQLNGFSTTFTNTVCNKNVACKGSAACSSNTTTNGTCNCSSDNQCDYGEFCFMGHCGTDPNLCYTGGNLIVGMTDTRHKTACGNHSGTETNVAGGNMPQTFQGGCGTAAGAGSATCLTPETCNTNADCGGGGKCVFQAALGVSWCTCGASGGTCNAPWSTCGANNFCLYASDCIGTDGGTVLINPNVPNFSSNTVLPWVNQAENYSDNNNGSANIVARIADPELRANGGTPLAGAARAATKWYTDIRDAANGQAADPKIACRPYVLVQLTDGVDSCDADSTNGPVAAAAGFVAATKAGAKNPNKVYVIGLAFGASAGPLDKIAQAGGTGQARLANSQQDIEAALADIVSSSVLKEICNDQDDNCNGQCDENFPDVAVDNALDPTCTPRAANTCTNGTPSVSQCYDTGVFVCSADKLSEVCSAQVCNGGNGGTITSPAAGVMRVSNVTGITSNMIGELLFVKGSAKAGNNGAFVISAVGAGTVDVTNAGVTVPDGSTVSYGVPSTQGAGATITKSAANTERLTLPFGTTAGVLVGDQVTVVGGAPVADNGTYTVTAVTATTIDLNNANAVAGTAVAAWGDPRLCPGVEVCDGKDNDCNGVIDDCTPGVPNSCSGAGCNICVPKQETCNGLDDNCNMIIDDNPVDAGGVCNNNNVGDCAPSHFVCCTTDPNSTTCTQGATDKLWCKGGNPGYPKATDLCDGTDDNCNGTPNDGPPQICYTNAAGMVILTPAQDGVGACHSGTQLCTTAPLPAGDPGCPAGWPAGKVCPNPTHTYGACSGAVGPQNEACNGIDDDCDGTVDDNLKDPWADPTNPAYPTAHPCCSTGNLADCMGANGSPCHVGGYQCVGGMKVCVGSQPKTTEICDKIDNDCNGSVDDLPGRGTACTGPGINTTGTCTAQNDCVYAPDPKASPNLVCVQKTFPGMETCNGLDDNCNGEIDDNNPPNAVNPLPGVGVPCMVPMPPADKPPCKAGTTVCIAGNIVCQGAVGPMPNQCNGISTDCTGNPNTNGNCPTGFQCYQGNCVAPCQPGEFPCPGGYACNQNTNSCDINGVHNGCCVPDACANLTCPPGFNCQLDANGNASCADPCAKVMCPPSYVCKLGTCVDGSCRTQGCPDGEVCVNDPTSDMFVCQPDPCAGVMCDGNQFCQGGVCVNTCAGPCPNGQYCSKGQCVPDPCAHTPCVEGQVCQVQNGVGVCVENQCQFGCNLGQACCGGECVADGCENLHCPEDTHCRLTPDCAATCETNPASPKDQVVGAGGGGFGCAVSGSASDSSSLAWLIVVAGALLFRRRRTAEVRK